MGNAYIGAGIAEGANKAFDYAAGMPERQARRQEAQARADMASAKLQDYTQGADQRQSERDLAIAQNQAQTYAANKDFLNKQTFDAWENYSQSGDVTLLNNTIGWTKNNQDPKFNGLYHDITSFEPLQDTPEMRTQLAQAGYQDVDGILGDQDMRRHFVVANTPDGQKQIVDATQGKIYTGYLNYANQKQKQQLAQTSEQIDLLKKMPVADIKQRDTLAQMLVDSGTVSSLAVAKAGLTPSENRGSKSQFELLGDTIAQANPDWTSEQVAKEQLKWFKESKSGGSGGFGSTEQERAWKILHAQEVAEGVPEEKQTSYQKYIDEGGAKPTAGVKTANKLSSMRKELPDIVSSATGGNYTNITPENIEQLRQDPEFAEWSANYLTTAGYKPTTKERDVFSNGAMIANLASKVKTDPEGKTAETTGLVDSLLSKAGGYTLYDSGSEGRQALQFINNLTLKMLSGATVTDEERAQFNDYAPNIQKQIGSILTSMKTVILEPTLTQVDQYMDMMDPTTALIVAGQTKHALESNISRMNNGLARIRGELGVKGEPISKTTTAKDIKVDLSKPAGTHTKSLDDWMGGN